MNSAISDNCFHCSTHSFILNEFQISRNKIGKARYFIDILTPYKFGSEYALCNLTYISGCPKILQKGYDGSIVIRYDIYISSLATLVICDDGCQSEDKSLREFTLALQICLESRQVASLVLRE